MYIGVIAGNRQQFMDWVYGEVRLAPSITWNLSRNSFEVIGGVVHYIASFDAARGLEFDMIIMTGRYADRWSDEQINELHLRLR